MDTQHKYLKYKNKYLQLKGGLLNINDTYKNITSFGFEFETSLMPFFGEVRDDTLILTPFGYKELSRDDTQNRSNTKIKLQDIIVSDTLVGELVLTQDSYDVFDTPESKQINVNSMTLDESLTHSLNNNDTKFTLNNSQEEYKKIQFNVQKENNLTIGDTEFVCTFKTPNDNILNINSCSEAIISRLKQYLSPPNSNFIGDVYISYEQYYYDEFKEKTFTYKNDNFALYKIQLDDISKQSIYVLIPFNTMYDDILYKYIQFAPQITLGTPLNNIIDVISTMISYEHSNSYLLDPRYKFIFANYLITTTIDKLTKQISALSKLSKPINYETLDDNILLGLNVDQSLITRLKSPKNISDGIKIGKELDQILKPKNIAEKISTLKNSVQVLNINKDNLVNYLFFYYLYVDVENLTNYLSQDNNNFEIHKYGKFFLPRQHFHEILEKTQELKECVEIIYNNNFNLILTYRIQFLQYLSKIIHTFNPHFKPEVTNIPLNFYENYDSNAEVKSLFDEYINKNFITLNSVQKNIIIKILLHEMPMFIGIKNGDLNDQINSFTTRIPYDGKHVIFEYRNLSNKTSNYLSLINNFLNLLNLDTLELITKRYKTEYLINSLPPDKRPKYKTIIFDNERKVLDNLIRYETELIELINRENTD